MDAPALRRRRRLVRRTQVLFSRPPPIGDVEVYLPRLHNEAGVDLPTQFKSFVPPAVSPALVLARLFAWLMAGLRLALRIGFDRLRGTLTDARAAADFRRVLESMGPTAIKVGRRIAMRLDLLPNAYASELSKIRDAAKPMLLRHAIERVEAVTKRPLEAIFSAFDPTPIISDSIACVYQAVLRNGEKVAVRVRRPEAVASFAAERLAISFILRALAPILPMRRGFIAQIERELPRLLFDDLDFVRAARLQRLFRKEARKSKLDFLTAAKVHIELCSPDVMVSEFVSGVWLDEVIAAREKGDPEAVAKLKSLDIDPDECGRRLLHACWWGFFECMFFCELPAASRIVVRPKGQLVFVGLGDIGILGRRQRKLLQAAFERFADYDVEGGVGMLVQLLMPLPTIDVNEFSLRIRSRIWRQLFTMSNEDSTPIDRASTALWLALFETTREYGVTVGLDLSRMMQSACLYDNMATRLWPQLQLFKEFRRYQRDQLERADEEAARKRRQRPPLVERTRDGFQVGRSAMLQLPGIVEQLSLWAESLVENAPLQQVALNEKGAYVVLQTGLAIAQVGRLALIAAVLRTGWIWYTTRVLDVAGAVSWVLGHPVLMALMFIVLITAARRVLFRLDDVDDKRR